MFNKIAFVGLGLIGGSLARRIREVFPNIIISATARSSETISYALRNNIIDETAADLEMVVHNAKLIIVATPLDLIVNYVHKLVSLVSPEAVIVDIGSTKGMLCKQLKKYTNFFIGGHPMCGTEKTGIQNADPRILDDAVFALTPYTNTPTAKVSALTEFLKNLKMRPEIFDPLEHDEAVAAISHLPYFVASALLQNAGAPAAKKLAASGFRSTTRVAESDPVWGLDIAKTNKKALLRQLSVLQKNLKAFKALIAEDRYAEILKLLKTNREVRRSIYP
jgi:prephenate dehydrogenase